MNLVRLTDQRIKIKQETVFALDTNVILWMFYGRLTPFKEYQTKIYPSFVTDIISNGNKVLIALFNLNEVFHAIEKNEHKIYCEVENKDISLKKFRKIKSEREKIHNTISLIYKQIRNIENVEIVPSNADEEILNEFLAEYNVHNSDFFDFFLIRYGNEHNLSIVTDDADFTNKYTQVDIYTANKNAK